MASLAGGALLALESGCRPDATIEAPDAGEPSSTTKCPTPKLPTIPPGSENDREAPRITAARFNGSDRVILHFSEGLEAPDQVNPRQFRVSEAYSTVDHANAYASATYYDLATRYGDELPLVFADIEQVAPDELELILNRPIPPMVCENLRLAQEDLAAQATVPGAGALETRHGLYLHYTKRGSVGLRDLAGNQLDDFGAAWALHFGTRDMRMGGQAPVVRLDLLIELVCPAPSEFVGPPGPA